MALRRWNSAVDGTVSEATIRSKLEALGYKVARCVYSPGTVFPDHTHGVDKIDAVIAGRFRLVLGGHLTVLGPGDWIEIPRGAVHNAVVVGEEEVIAFDAIKI